MTCYREYSTDRWQQIEALYNAARKKGSGILSDADPSLRREVERLLVQDSGRIAQAEAALKLASDRNFKNAEFLIHRYDLAFLKGDVEEMRRQAGLAQGRQGAEGRWLNSKA